MSSRLLLDAEVRKKTTTAKHQAFNGFKALKLLMGSCKARKEAAEIVATPVECM